MRSLLARLLLILCCIGGAMGAALATPPLQGYTDRLSYAPGERIDFHVSSSVPRYHVSVQRIGAQRETVWRGEIADGREHSIPPDASARGADWPTSFSVTVPPDWRSGYYEVFLGAPDPVNPSRWIEGQSLFFVVRPGHPGRDTSILLQLATNTYSAYESWGGRSLYAFNSPGGRPGRKVSFRRPLNSGAHAWEVPFIEWAERSGYRLDYAVNGDLQLHPELLPHYRLLLSVGHDEYWSAPMRDNVEAFVAGGGNVAFFGGNAIAWQVRLEDDGRTLVAWKEAFRDDPLYRDGGPNPLLTTLWSHPRVRRPENALTGVGMQFGGMHRSHGQFMQGSGAFTAQRTAHWVFAGTGLRDGDAFGGAHKVVGYETDGCDVSWVDGKPVPTHRDGTPASFVVLATAPARWPPDMWGWLEGWDSTRVGNACMGIHTGPGGGTVFTAATTDWSHGLRGRDAVVERITRNVLDRLSGPPRR